MNKIVVGSLRPGAGKTSVIVGLSQASAKSVGYLKPFGDRLIYKDKKLMDLDNKLMAELLQLQDLAEHMCIGCDHSKLHYMYNAESLKNKLNDSANAVGNNKATLLIEGSQDLMFGAHVGLDTLSLTTYLDAKLVIVIDGNNDSVVDDLYFIHHYLKIDKNNFLGVIINKIPQIQEFNQNYLPRIKETGLPVLGTLPTQNELGLFTVRFLSKFLFAKVITGEQYLDRNVKNILIGAMSVAEPLKRHLAAKESKLLITSGDRQDMILAAIEGRCSALILTNDVIPGASIIAKAEESQIPLLLVPYDTYYTANQIDNFEALITIEDVKKIESLKGLIPQHIKLEQFML